MSSPTNASSSPTSVYTPKKYTSHKELTEEELLAMPTQYDRAIAAMQVLPGLLKQVEAGINESKGCFNASFISTTSDSRKKLLAQSLSLTKESSRCYMDMFMMIQLAVEELKKSSQAEVQRSYTRMVSWCQAGMNIEVLDEHREDFWNAFVAFLKPLADEGNKIAALAIDPKEKKNVLNDGYQALIRMVKIAKTVDGIPNWIPDTYGFGRHYLQHVTPTEVELALNQEEETKQKAATAAVATAAVKAENEEKKA